MAAFLEKWFPFAAAPTAKLKSSAPVEPDKLVKSLKTKVLGQGYDSGYIPYRNIKSQNFEEAPYDFEEIEEAIDADSYVEQAFLKYQDLFFKEGWQIVGENPAAVEYLYQRIDLMEEAMQKPFDDFLSEVVDEWIKYSNAFLVKARGSLNSYYTNMGPDTVIGYTIIPTKTVEILRDEHNRISKYRQGIFDGYMAMTDNPPTWKAEDVLHLYLNRKQGYAFGKPLVSSGLDDVHSLRLMEQDILNLVHQELFPLFKFKVGNDTKPASQEELDDAAETVNEMRANGGVVLSDRQDVDVVGADGNALKADPYVSHFKERVAIGLGVFPHHLGMSTQGTNRSATDRLDTALYDRVKRLQRKFEGFVRTRIFNELLREGGFNPITTPSSNGMSDRCYMKFREIDIDTQIKQENHTVNKFNNNVIDWKEAREELGLSGEADPQLLLMTMTAQIQAASAEHAAAAAAKYAPKPVASATKTGGSAPAPKKPDAIPSSTGITPNLPNQRKDTGNKVAPSNQFGRRLSPNVRHNDDEFYTVNEDLLESVVELLSVDDPGEINE